MENSLYSDGLKYEIKRKSIHIFSLVIPVSYYFIGRDTMLILLFFLSTAMIIIDILRFRNNFIKNRYDKYLGDILRKHENGSSKIYFTGGTYIVISFLICVLLFQKNIAILSMMIIIICDTAAALTGKMIGKHRIGGKTLEGSLSFLVTAIILFFLIIKPGDSQIIFWGITSVVLTTIFELLPLKIDDNISIPLFFGIIYSVLTKSNFLI